MRTYTTWQNAALLILRIITASIFYVAAYFKIPFWKSAPEGLSSWLLTVTKILSIAEPLGATAILIGVLTRWAAAGLSVIMIGAIFVSQFVYGIGFVTPTSAGWNMALSVLGGCLILVAFGPGDWAIDRERRRN